ncbi:MAG: siphovirus Gp157 family protein, partial [Flammeovirgaceae bacterium]
FENKSIAYGHVIRRLDAECDIIDSEIKRLQSIKRSRESALERLKMRIKAAMETFGMDKVQTPTLKLSFRKSESVEVEDVNALPSMYKTLKVTESPDKTLIKESLKLGKEIPGARLVTNNNLQ